MTGSIQRARSASASSYVDAAEALRGRAVFGDLGNHDACGDSGDWFAKVARAAFQLGHRGVGQGAGRGGTGTVASRLPAPYVAPRTSEPNSAQVRDTADASSDRVHGRQPCTCLMTAIAKPAAPGLEMAVGGRRALQRPTSSLNRRSLQTPNPAPAKANLHAPGKIRTCDLSLRRRALYPLSYGRRGRLMDAIPEPGA